MNRYLAIRRAIVGAVGLLCVLLGAILLLLGGEGAGIAGSLWRVGTLLAAIWLAWPLLVPRFSKSAELLLRPWEIALAVVCLLVLARLRLPLRYLLAGLLIIAVAALVLWPRSRRR